MWLMNEKGDSPVFVFTIRINTFNLRRSFKRFKKSWENMKEMNGKQFWVITVYLKRGIIINKINSSLSLMSEIYSLGIKPLLRQNAL